MSRHTHILDKPNVELENIINEVQKKKDLIKDYIEKNKTLKGIGEATGIKFVDPLSDSKR